MKTRVSLSAAVQSTHGSHLGLGPSPFGLPTLGEARKQIVVRVSAETHQRLMIAAAQNAMKVQWVLADAIENFLDESEKKHLGDGK